VPARPGLTGGLPRVVAGLATGHVIVQGISATGREAARDLVNDRNDLPNDIAAVTTAGAVEQIAHRGADLCFSVVRIAKIPIEFI
jgi:hypothetical protein